MIRQEKSLRKFSFALISIMTRVRTLQLDVPRVTRIKNPAHIGDKRSVVGAAAVFRCF